MSSLGGSMRVVQVPIRVARDGVARLHRHHRPPLGGKVAYAVDVDGQLTSFAIVGRPVSRVLQARGYMEVTRVATDGTRNACSALYGAAARWARKAGHSIVTYTLASEPGTSLRAAGWVPEAFVRGRRWSCPSRPRRPGDVDGVDKIRWAPAWCGTEDPKLAHVGRPNRDKQ